MADNALEIIIDAKDNATAKLDGVKTNIKSMAVAAAGVGAAITGAMALSIKAAGEAQEAMANVNATLATMGKKGEDARAGILEAAAATVKLGFDDEAAAQSITNLFQRTGDLTSAIKTNQLAMDLARAKHIDLATASNAVGMALSGNGKVLKQFGIDIKEAGTPAEALVELQKKLAGQSEAFAKTYAGSSEILKNQIGNLQEKIGEQLLPIIARLVEAVVPIIEKMLAWAEANPKLTQAIVVVTAAVGGLLVVLPILLGLIAAIAAPIGITVLAIAGLSAAVIALGVIIALNWTAIKDKTIEIFNKVRDTIKDAFEQAKMMVISAIDAMIDKINALINAANKVTSVVSGIGINVPKISTIPRLAEGGIVNSPTIAMIGEAGPEAVVPLGRGGGMAGGANVTVIVNGDVSGQELVEKVGQSLTDMLKLNFSVV